MIPKQKYVSIFGDYIAFTKFICIHLQILHLKQKECHSDDPLMVMGTNVQFQCKNIADINSNTFLEWKKSISIIYSLNTVAWVSLMIQCLRWCQGAKLSSNTNDDQSPLHMCIPSLFQMYMISSRNGKTHFNLKHIHWMWWHGSHQYTTLIFRWLPGANFSSNYHLNKQWPWSLTHMHSCIFSHKYDINHK